MVQQAQKLATKSDNLSSVLSPTRWKMGTDFYMCTMAHTFRCKMRNGGLERWLRG